MVRWPIIQVPVDHTGDTAGVGAHGAELTGITRGGTVAVIGPGPIGILAMRTARLMGASRIIAVGRGTRLEAAGRLAAEDRPLADR